MKKQIPIKGMHCASCAQTIEKSLQKVEGVKQANVNFASEKASVEYDDAITKKVDLKKAVEDAGYEIIEEVEHGDSMREGDQGHDPNMSDMGEHDHAAMLKKEELQILKKKVIFGAAISVLVLIGSMQKFFPGLSEIPKQVMFYILWAFTTPVLIWSGAQFFTGAWRGLKHFRANMDTLILMGTSAAYFYSVVATLFPQFFETAGQEAVVYFDTTAIIITLILFGKYLESKAKSGASEAIKN